MQTIVKSRSSRRLNMYEKLINKAAECHEKAMNATSSDIAVFFLNAEKGFIVRAKNLKISEVV
jgi:hypothetical protein